MEVGVAPMGAGAERDAVVPQQQRLLHDLHRCGAKARGARRSEGTALGHLVDPALPELLEELQIGPP